MAIKASIQHNSSQALKESVVRKFFFIVSNGILLWLVKLIRSILLAHKKWYSCQFKCRNWTLYWTFSPLIVCACLHTHFHHSICIPIEIDACFTCLIFYATHRIFDMYYHCMNLFIAKIHKIYLRYAAEHPRTMPFLNGFESWMIHHIRVKIVNCFSMT